MALSALFKFVLPLVIVVVALAHTAPTAPVNACSCNSEVPRIALEQHRTAVLAQMIGQRGDLLVYNVENAYGADIPEQVLLPINECDLTEVNGDSIGFAIVEFEDQWHRVKCSSADTAEFYRLANSAGLIRREPVPVANLIQFDEAGVEIKIESPAETALPAKDLSTPVGRQPGDQSMSTPGNGMSLVLVLFGGVAVVVVLVLAFTRKQAR